MDYSAIAPEEAALTGMAVAVYAARKPGEIAIVDRFRETSWGDLNARANQIASFLRSQGLGTDEAVALLCSNRAEFVEVFMGAYRCGVRVTPINWHLTGEEIGYIVDNCDAQVFFFEDQYAGKAREAIAMSPALKRQLAIGSPVEDMGHYGTVLDAEPAVNIDNPVHGGSMLYTSGTTGHPKGVYRRERPPLLPDFSEVGYAKGDEVDLCTGPAYHAAPLLIDVMQPITSGSRVVFMDKWDPEETLRLIDRHRVTHTHMVATMFHRLLQLPDDVKAKYDVGSLRFVVHGAAPTPVHVKHAMIEWFGPKLLEYYAATEGGGGFLIDSHTWLRKPGSVGCPGPEFDNRILDDEGNEVAQGETGTIYMRAPDTGRFQYYKDETKTSKSYSGDYFTLGDMGYFDEDGFLFLTGRTAELIISSGVNIYPQEVDSEIMQHPAVHDVCTIGVPNEEWGEEVKSVINANPGFVTDEALADELIAFARDRLPHFMCPKTIDFVDDLPRLPTGKIQRRIVREPYWAGRDKQI